MNKKILFPLFLILLSSSIAIYQNCSPAQFDAFEGGLKKDDTPYICQEKDAPGLKPVEAYRWRADGGPQPDYRHVMASPMVGDINGDGKPEVVFVSYKKETGYDAAGVLRVVSGQDMKEIFSIGGTLQPDLAPLGDTTPLLISLDGTPDHAEIIYVHYSLKKVIALNSDGTTRWTVPLPATDSISGAPAALTDCIGGPAAVDLDSDGKAEVLVENYLISEKSGTPTIQQIAPRQKTSCTTFAITLDPKDPNSLGIVTGSQVLDKNLNVIATFPPSASTSRGRRLAAAEIDSAHPGIEVVYAEDGVLHMWNVKENKELWSVPIPGGSPDPKSNGNAGGPPAISDFNGDGKPDIAVASDTHYAVFNSDGTNLWRDQTTHDFSSAITGSTIFDFNGDGKSEILYADEGYLHFYNGFDGTPFLEKLPNPSHTHLEYPVVADVDGDGHSEILLVSNTANLAASNWATPDEVAAIAAVGPGIRVFKAASAEAWVPTRKVWNQYSYFVNNVTEHLQATSYRPETQDFFRRNLLNQFSAVCK